jgi:hypothetical protein
MSIKWSGMVWHNSQQTGSALLVLLAIADHANDDGICWPSVARLARMARVSERQCQRLISQLVDAGELAVERGGHGPKSTTVYRMLVLAENKGDIQGNKGDTVTSPLTENKGDIQRAKGDIQRAKGDTAMSPEPSIEPSIEAAEARASEPTPEPTPEPTAPAAAAKSQPTRDAWIIEYENVWGMMVASPYIGEQITDWQSRVTFPAWQHALRESTRANARNWRYLSRVLERLERDGYQEPQATPTATTIDIDLELPL